MCGWVSGEGGQGAQYAMHLYSLSVELVNDVHMHNHIVLCAQLGPSLADSHFPIHAHICRCHGTCV